LLKRVVAVVGQEVSMWSALFPHNEHRFDRTLRIVIGAGLLWLAFSGQTAWGYIGIVPLLTGIIGSCPVYSLFGWSTCPHTPGR
jgi:hypothetical protein